MSFSFNKLKLWPTACRVYEKEQLKKLNRKIKHLYNLNTGKKHVFLTLHESNA